MTTHRTVVFKSMAVALGLVLGAVAAVVVYQVVKGAPSPAPAVAPEQLARGSGPRPATPYAYTQTPWFKAFAGRPRMMRQQLLPFSSTCEDSSVHTDGCPVARQNSHGFRGPEYTISHPPDTIRVVVIGDSYTWGDGILVEQTYHRQLQRRFDERAASGHQPRVEVIALGINGNSFFEHVITLELYAARLKPDVVLFQLCGNDLEYRRNVEFFRDASWRPGVSDRIALLGALKALWTDSPEYERDRQSEEWQIFRAALRSVQDWQHKTHVPVGFVSLAGIGRPNHPPDFDRLNAGQGVLAQMEGEVGRLHFPVLRAWDALRARAGEKPAAVPNGHYDSVANAILGDALFEGMTRTNWLPLPKALGPAAHDWERERTIRAKAGDEWDLLYQSLPRQREMFSQLLAILPEEPWLANSLAFVVRRMGESGEARRLLERLPELAPDMAAPWYEMTLGSTDEDDRRRLLETMVRTVPDSPDAAYDLATLDAAAGHQAAACGCFRVAADHARYSGQFDKAIEGLRLQGCPVASEAVCPGVVPPAAATPRAR